MFSKLKDKELGNSGAGLSQDTAVREVNVAIRQYILPFPRCGRIMDTRQFACKN